jgi:ABC-2 type transport system permease protein
MRAALIDHTFRTDQFFTAVGLNVIYLSLGIAVFLYVFRSARRRGLLLNIGE